MLQYDQLLLDQVLLSCQKNLNFRILPYSIDRRPDRDTRSIIPSHGINNNPNHLKTFPQRLSYFLYYTKHYNKKQIQTKMAAVLRQPQALHLSVLRYDLFFVIWTAGLAYSVRYHKLAALAALYQRRNIHLPVSSSLISPALGRFILRTYRHFVTSLMDTPVITYHLLKPGIVIWT